MPLKATKIYARFASEVYDDFGEVDYEQEYYRKEHAEKEIRATKHALWMAKAEICLLHSFNCSTACHSLDWDEQVERWQWAERKCREKAKEFE